MQARSRRAVWSGVDQAISSLTNVALGVVVAASVSRSAFGAFSIAFLLYTLALGLASSLVSEPLVVSYARAKGTSAAAAHRAALGTSTSIGAAAGTVLVLSGMILDDPLRQALVPLGLLLPGLLLQDAVRNVHFARGTPSGAAANDAAWAFAQAAAFIVLARATERPSLVAFVVAWGGAAWIAAVIGLIQLRHLPDVRQVARWLRTHAHLGRPFAADFALRTGASHLGMYGVGIVAGLGELGSLRAALLLMGPVSVVTAGVRVFALPEGARLRDTAPERLLRAALGLGALLGAFSVAWGAAALSLPSGWGAALLGDSWVSARRILPLVVVVVVAGAGAGPPLFGLRILGDGKRTLVVRRLDAPLTVVATVTGALVADAQGAATGWATANVVASCIWWRQFTRSHAAFLDGKTQGVVTQT